MMMTKAMMMTLTKINKAINNMARCTPRQVKQSRVKLTKTMLMTKAKRMKLTKKLSKPLII